jgi:hypothetical protein
VLPAHVSACCRPNGWWRWSLGARRRWSRPASSAACSGSTRRRRCSRCWSQCSSGAFLPGAALTMAVVELSAAEMITRASRLVAGPCSFSCSGSGSSAPPRWWACPRRMRWSIPRPISSAGGLPGSGVLLVGIGKYLYFSARRRAGLPRCRRLDGGHRPWRPLRLSALPLAGTDTWLASGTRIRLRAGPMAHRFRWERTGARGAARPQGHSPA